MSAIAGPGPSSMASSTSSPPMVPLSVRQKMKKRVINLVNPADPQEFSHQSITPDDSPDTSLEMDRRLSREETPTMNVLDGPLPVFTIKGVDDNGVRGILRQTGTPGSGNGVRFFPKNRFRVITPTASPATPQPRSTSLFSQLLSVVPPLSPLRLKPTTPDESWEQPGQEGEVSLVASSVISGDRTMESIPGDDEEILPKEEESWTGTPTQISSPLALPTEFSREISLQDLPSLDIQVPEDMSNLLSTRLSPPPGDSFSIIRQPDDSMTTTRTAQRLVSSNWEDEDSIASNIQDDNPTIRRKISPSRISTQIPTSPHSPTLSNDGRPFRSIFADMSAEQADLSWPLVRPPLETTQSSQFHDISLTSNIDLPDLPLSKSRSKSTSGPNLSATPFTPRSGNSIGNETEYFDASSFGMMTPGPKLPTTITAPPSTSVPNLLNPAKALFEAQAEHTSALIAELTLYRDLAQRLQVEVSERDDLLADLNLLAVEAEILREQNMDLQKALSSNRQQEGDRTTMIQAEHRDLEIRLAKSLGDQEVLAKQLNEIRAARDDVVRQLTESRKIQQSMEERDKDKAIGDGQLRLALKSAQDSRVNDLKMIESLQIELDEAKHTEENLDSALAQEREARQSVESELNEIRNESLEQRDTIHHLEQQTRELEQSSANELANLQKELARLRLESSSKDLEISSLQRRKVELKEDREMLNIALDSKQQELELLKRKYGVRGVAGSTPLGISRKVNVEATPGITQTPAGLSTDTKPTTTRKISGSDQQFETPLLTDRRSMRHGVPLHASTIKGKGMRAVAEELKLPENPKGSLRRQRMVAV